ncbi:hypothetical protein B0H13DRAFT_2376450 [Mycena leptocephala]|nr:hypothetical protein B0H13DRAFT_2376450 [Mycena leptocephala]
MSSLPPKNVSPLWAPFNHRCTEQLVEFIVEDVDPPRQPLDLLRLPPPFPPDCITTSRIQIFWYQINLLLEHVDDIPSSWVKYHIDLPVLTPTSLPNDFTLPVIAPPENLPTPAMSAYDERSGTPSPLKAGRQDREGPTFVHSRRRPSAAGPSKRNTRQNTKATAQAPAKSACKRTASVVSEDSEANSARRAQRSQEEGQDRLDEDEDKPVASTSSSAAKGKVWPRDSFAKLTPDRIKKIAQNLTDVLNRLVKDNKTDLVPTELNQINLFTETDSEYFVVLVKKRPSHVYKFSSHQPETSTNRTSRPDLAALPPLSKPVALIPEETVTQVSFENAITAIDSCLRCNLEHKRCIPLGLGASCANCIKERFRFCDHHLTLQEILDFHARVASDVIEADDKLPIFIASLNDATLLRRVLLRAPRRLDSPLHPPPWHRRVFIAFTSSDDTPTVVQHINALIETYNRLSEADLKDLDQNAPYDVDSELTKRRLRRMLCWTRPFRTQGPHHHRRRGDAETDQESAESEEVAAKTPAPKTPPKKPVSSKTDSGKGKDKPRRHSRCTLRLHWFLRHKNSYAWDAEVAPFGRNLIPYVHLEPYFLPAFYANRRIHDRAIHCLVHREYSDHATDLITERIIVLQTTTPVVRTSVPRITFDR